MDLTIDTYRREFLEGGRDFTEGYLSYYEDHPILRWFAKHGLSSNYCRFVAAQSALEQMDSN